MSNTAHPLHPLNIQLRLGIAATPSVSKITPEQARTVRKNSLIRGRPRRLQSGSKVVKVAIHPDKVKRIDRVRSMMNATRPELVRNAVHMYVGKHVGSELPQHKKTPRLKKGRCDYWKVPFSPAVLSGVDTLALQLGKKRRQQIINLALDEMLSQYV